VEPLSRSLTDSLSTPYLRYYLGSAALAEGNAGAARAHFEASLRELDAAGDDLARAVVLGSLGLLAARRGEHTEARAMFAESLPVLREGATSGTWPCCLLNAGLEEAQAESPAAGPLLTEALQAWQRLGGNAGMALTLAGLGRSPPATGRCVAPVQLLGACRALLPASDPLLHVIVP